MRSGFRALVVISLLAAPAALLAQASADRPSGRPGGPPASVLGATAAQDTILKTALRVYLDCQGGVRGCDRDFFVQELGFVNWVRDRFDSDVHLLLTSLNAGNGGREITINFLGQKKYAGKTDTLVINTLPNDADDRVRRELVRTFQLGLAPYIARTPIASRLRLSLFGPDGAAAACIPRFIAIVFRPVSRVRTTRTKLPSALVLDTSRHPLDTLVSATPSRGKLR